MNSETYKTYVARLLDVDLKKLGEGSAGTVFQHPTFANLVVKVVKHYGYYVKFARFALANPHNPYLPRVVAIQKVKFVDSPVGFLVFVEKLRPASDEAVERFFNQVPYEFRVPSVDRRLNRDGWKYLANSKNANVRQFAELMLANFPHLDLFTDNIMSRGSQLVFSDPLA